MPKPSSMKQITIIFLILTLGISCKNSKSESEQNSSKIPQIPTELSEFTMKNIQNIQQYINVYRLNNGVGIGIRTTDYNKLAEELNIPVSKLKSIDKYYYDVMGVLEKKIKTEFKHKNFEFDYYHPLESTAYCGIHTLRGNIIVYVQKSKTDFKAEAEKIANELIPEIPDWITGYKLNFTRYEDPNLETKGDVDIGFLWRKGENIKVMKSSRGLYGYEKPETNIHWHNREWNDQQTILYPKFGE